MIPRRPRIPRPPYPQPPRWSPAVQPPTRGEPLPAAILNPPVPLTAAQLLVGTLADASFPQRPLVDATPLDGRTAALQSLGVYLTSIVFCRPGPVGSNPRFFGVPPQNYFVDRPGPEVELPFPCIVAVAGPGQFQDVYVTIDDSTRDVYGPGTAISTHGEQEETVTLEIWSSTLPELRSIVAGLSKSFNPTQEREGMLLLMPNYYMRTARFMLENVIWQDDDGAVKNRRFAHITVFMAYDEVRLLNYVTMLPVSQADTEIPNYTQSGVEPLDPTIGGVVIP